MLFYVFAPMSISTAKSFVKNNFTVACLSIVNANLRLE